jgi:hypothetical protein
MTTGADRTCRTGMAVSRREDVMKIAPRQTSFCVFDRLTANRSFPLVAIATSLLLTACAGAAPNQSPALQNRNATTAGASHGIVEVTRNDLSAASTGSSLYSAIRYLRPRLLEPRPDIRGLPSSAIFAVYVNGIRVGSLEALETIPSNRVRKVEFLPADGRRPYGYRYEPGAILVTLIRDRL